MRTAIIDDILRRIDERAPTRLEIELLRESRRDAERLICAIAEPAGRRERMGRARERHFG